MDRNGFGGLSQYFEDDHVLKLLYIDNICPMSFPKFSKISFPKTPELRFALQVLDLGNEKYFKEYI